MDANIKLKLTVRKVGQAEPVLRQIFTAHEMSFNTALFENGTYTITIEPEGTYFSYEDEFDERRWL